VVNKCFMLHSNVTFYTQLINFAAYLLFYHFAVKVASKKAELSSKGSL
jgi:hypothetical protein